MSHLSPTPLHDVAYLSSLVETIKDSIADNSSVTFHDLLDAYSTLVERLESQDETLVLQDAAAHFAALECISLDKLAFLQALRRDVGRAHTDPSIDACAPPYEYFISNTISSDRRTDAIQRARDSMLLCNYALCALQCIFKYPAVFLLFTYTELDELFGDMLKSLAGIPAPVSPKIYALSLSILRSQRLPLAVISFRQVEVVKALSHCSEMPDMITDVLEAVIHILDQYADLFGIAAELLPLVLTHLLVESAAIRLLASSVLAKLAALLVKEPKAVSKQDRRTASTHVFNFLHGQAFLPESPDGESTFMEVVQVALQVDMRACPGNDPIWMVSLLASLIVLCGPSTFSELCTLEYVLDTLENLLMHTDAIVRALHSCVWRCLVWVYVQMLADPEDLNPSVVDLALCAMKQELGRGAGITLMSVLLCGSTHPREATRLEHALSVIQCMVHSECAQTKKDGMALLRRATTTDSSVNDCGLPEGLDDVLPVFLFDGSVVNVQWGELPTIIRGIPRFTLNNVPPLTETQINTYFQVLFDGWHQCMPRFPSEHLDIALVDVWRSLLCSLARNHTNARDAFNYAATSLTGCLLSPPNGPDRQSNGQTRNIMDQYRLIAVERLWFVMKDAAAAVPFPEAAHLILSAILNYKFNLDSELRGIRNTLCVDMMVFASAPVPGGTPTPLESPIMVRKHRQLWVSAADCLIRDACSLCWRLIVDFLCIPVRTWVVSESELGVWGSLLKCTKATSKNWNDIVDGIAHRLGEQDTAYWESDTQLFTIILGNFKEKQLPPNAVLNGIDSVLTCAYDQHSTMMGSLDHALHLLSVLRDHIVASTPEDVMTILVKLRGGLTLWIGDEMEVIAVDAFNSVVISLYRDTLDVLEKLPLSQEALDNLEPFLASGFSRIPAPAIAPFAFEKFWRATYYGHTQFYDNLPPKIKVCLTGFVNAFGGDLAYGLAMSTDSPSQSQDLFASSRVNEGASHESIFLEHASQSLHVDDPSREPSLLNQSSLRRELQDTRFIGDVVFEEEDVPSIVDTAFILPSSDASQDEAFDDEIDDHGHLFSASILYPQPDALPPSSPDPRRSKRARTPEDSNPRKRGRISPKIPTDLRKTQSEPVSRRNTPLSTVRPFSVPVTNKRMVLDCVEVSTFRSVLDREKKLRSQRAPQPRSRLLPTYRMPPTVKTGSTAKIPSSPLPPSVSSEVEDNDDSDDWHDPRDLQRTSSEIVVDESLAQAYPSSPGSPGPISQSKDHDRTTLIRSQTEVPQAGPSRAPLRRTKTTSSTRLDMLQDAYAAVTDDASQISVTDLIKSTTLVHKIGAALSEQITKRFGKPTS